MAIWLDILTFQSKEFELESFSHQILKEKIIASLLLLLPIAQVTKTV